MNPDDKKETKMKTKMKVAVCTLLCMTMACAAANAEGGTTNSTNSGRPQTQRKNNLQSGGVVLADDSALLCKSGKRCNSLMYGI